METNNKIDGYFCEGKYTDGTKYFCEYKTMKSMVLDISLNDMTLNLSEFNYFVRYNDGREELIDLFEIYPLIPKNVQEILDKYESEEQTYGILGAMLTELNAVGYTFDYGLDASPYNLRKIETV